jgi:hypothetical protein
MVLTVRRAAEMFQLVFLRALTTKGEDKGLIALKGGANLRFYFGSVRLSEDIDLDVVVIARETLKKKVDRLLDSPLVRAPLAAQGLSIVEASAPKQTDTTQRWKVGLKVEGSAVEVRTKIEFSRRDAIEGAELGATDGALARSYGLGPVLANHYACPAAIGQKVRALAGRAEPQARDVFDLSVLFARPDAARVVLDRATKGQLPVAIENAMSIGYDEHVSKVVAYLDPDHAPPYEGQAAFRLMQDTVVAELERLR